MKLLTIAALAASIALPASMAFAQTDTTATDPAFWSGDWMRDFYTDDAMTTMKASAEAQAAFAKMNPETQAKLKVACAGTYDRKFSDICKAAAM